MLEDWTACACQECQKYCEKRPCWPTPEEAKSLIQAGYGPRLMRDYWVGDLFVDPSQNIQILSPAIVGFEGKDAPFLPLGRCTFSTASGLCRLHSLGLKPMEARLSLCGDRTPGDLHQKVASTWNNQEGQRLAQEFIPND